MKLSEFLETLREERDLLSSKIRAIDEVIAAYQTDTSPSLNPAASEDETPARKPRGRRSLGTSRKNGKPPKAAASSGRRLSPEQRKEILDLHAKGISNKEIAEQTGVQYSTVWLIIKKSGEAEPKDSDRELARANHPEQPAEISDEELAAEIRRRVDEGQSSFHIARDLRVSLKRINQHWPNRTQELSGTTAE